MNKLRFAPAFAFALLVAGSSFAATFIVPTDRELVHAAKAIVVATAQGSYAERVDERMINTVYLFRVDEVIKGDVPLQNLRVAEPGGFLGGEGVFFPGAPSYAVGERALIFLDVNQQGDFRTWSMGIGKFNFVSDAHGKRLLMRGQGEEAIFGWDSSGNAYREIIRAEETFLQFVRDEACGGVGDANYGVNEASLVWQPKIKANVNGSGFHACDYSQSFIAGTCGYKWKDIFDQPGGGGSVNFALVGTQTGGVDGPAGVSAGMAAWNSNALSNVNLGVGASSNQIKFDDNAGVAPCGGAAVGCASFGLSGASFPFDGGMFAPLTAVEISFKSAFPGNQQAFNQAACHELGHTIGIRHSDAGTPSTASAVMNSSVNLSSPVGANLQPWDVDAVQTIYNPSPGVVCTPPSVTSATANPSTIGSGGSTTLSATASGTAPTFQWYRGNPPDTTNPAGPAGASISVSPTVNTTYWVRATGQCPPVSNSGPVTVTVQPCTAPSSAVASATQTTIAAGSSTTLQLTGVNGSGPLSYQWYTGSPPNGAVISGQTNTTMTVSPLATTTYYVRVTNSCAFTDSNAVTITVQQPQCLPVTSATALASPSSVTANGATQLSATSNGTNLNKSYQWFTGDPPGTPLTTAQNFQANPLTTTTFYFEVSNPCSGPVRSNLVTVTVVPQCVPPSNAVATATPAAITSGQTSNLAVSAAGTGLTFQWFTGTPPAGTMIPDATAATLAVSPTVTTTYYARVTGQCGTPREIDSNPVTVTVTAACVPASISIHPENKSVFAGTPALLSVEAAGTAPLHYQWFEGATGAVTKPVGSDSENFTSAPLMKRTQFWVRVTGNCGQPVSSNTATIEVKGGRPRPVKH